MGEAARRSPEFPVMRAKRAATRLVARCEAGRATAPDAEGATDSRPPIERGARETERTARAATRRLAGALALREAGAAD